MPSTPETKPRAKAKELIFVNHQALVPDQRQDDLQQVPGTSKQTAATSDEKVDMEIIILNPRRDKRSREKSKSKSASKSATQVDEPAATADEASTALSEGPTASPAVNETLLKRLEKQYGQKRIVQADDNTYVDYMDYF